MYEDLSALLKARGASLTQPRKVIFSILLNNSPLTIQEIINKADGQIDRATVYRVLELFEDLGITNRLNIGWKHKYELSDVFHGHHHHFYCTNCGKTYDLPPNNMLETMINSVATNENYAPRGHQLEIYGFCADCSKK